MSRRTHKIDTIRLRCPAPESQYRFYSEVLGMTMQANGTLGYNAQQAGLKFDPALQPYQPTSTDTYWKIALAVPNIELACKQLTAHGVQVGTPRQFQNIGYLAHFQDPQGFTVELIEHWFQGNRPDIDFDTSLLGGGACLNLLTLRTHDIAPLRAAFLAWGMAALSVQSVDEFGFTLYFFAFTHDRPPNPDLTAVENREWLYQRPYTVLEIQEVKGADISPLGPVGSAGYSGTEIVTTGSTFDNSTLMIRGAP